ELPPRHQVEDQVLALRRRLESDVLRRLHRQRQRQGISEAAVRFRGGRRSARGAETEAHDRDRAHPPHLGSSPHHVQTTDDANTLLATTGAPFSSRLARYSALTCRPSPIPTFTPPVIR